MRGSSLTQQNVDDPHLAVVSAVTLLAVDDALAGDGSAWLYLWTCAPDLAAALWGLASTPRTQPGPGLIS